MRWDRLNPARHPGWLMGLLVLGYGLGSMLWGERLPKADGFGWDGHRYRFLTEHFAEGADWISPYTARRCLPSLAARLAIEAFQQPLDGPHILGAFAAVNLVLFLATLAALLGCCRAAGVGPVGKWLMFVGSFVNYAHLKQYHYAVCQTDVWATALSALILWAYLARRPFSLLALAAAGAFAWPVLIHVGSLLYLFPRPEVDGPDDPSPRARWSVAAGVGLAAALATAYLVFVRQMPPVQPDQVIRRLLPVSIGLIGVFLFAGLAPLLGGRTMTDWRPYFSPGWVGRVVALAAVWVAVEAVQARIDVLYTRVSPVPRGIGDFLSTILLFAASKPLSFLVAHAAWFGPVVALGAWLWPAVCREARRFGPGLVLLLGAGLVMALSAESRQSLTFFPAFALLTACAAQRQGWGAKRVALFGVVALAASRVWLPLNVTPWPEATHLYEFPMQRFFMSCGYMTTRSYVWLGLAGLAMTGGVVGIGCWRRGGGAGGTTVGVGTGF